jgi:toxin ParE1/3/4
MASLVRISGRAERDLAAIYLAINAENSDAAFRWFNGLERALFTLEENPTRCPVTPENPQYRHLLYGNKPHVYRVIYRVLEPGQDVEILHIRHGARQPFKPGDLK